MFAEPEEAFLVKMRWVSEIESQADSIAIDFPFFF